MATTAAVAAPGIPDAPPREARGDEGVHLRVREPLTIATAARALGLLLEYVRLGRVRLLLDLEMVPAIDVCGVAVLLRGQRLLEAEGGVLLLHVNPTVRRALEESRTISAFHLTDRPAASAEDGPVRERRFEEVAGFRAGGGRPGPFDD